MLYAYSVGCTPDVASVMDWACGVDFLHFVLQYNMPRGALLGGAAADDDLLAYSDAGRVFGVQTLHGYVCHTDAGVLDADLADGLASLALVCVVDDAMPLEAANQAVERRFHGSFYALHCRDEHLVLVRAAFEFAAQGKDFVLFHADCGLEHIRLRDCALLRAADV